MVLFVFNEISFATLNPLKQHGIRKSTFVRKFRISLNQKMERVEYFLLFVLNANNDVCKAQNLLKDNNTKMYVHIKLEQNKIDDIIG